MAVEPLALFWLTGGALAHAVLVVLLGRWAGWRDIAHVVLSGLAAVSALVLVGAAVERRPAALSAAWADLPGAFALAADPLSAFGACLIAFCGLAVSLYAVGYVRALKLAQPARLLGGCILGQGAASGLVLSANLITLLVFYVALGLAGALLIGHGSAGRAARAGQRFLSSILGCALGLLLPAILWAGTRAGSVAFVPGGFLAGAVTSTEANILLLLLFGGLGAAAAPPLHGLARDFALAPTPAAALALAAMVGVGLGAALLKVTVFVFGVALPDADWARPLLIAICAAAVAISSLALLSQQSLRERLGWLAASQLSLLGLGALIGGAATLGAVLQLGVHAVTLLTLSLAVGAIHAATGREFVRHVPGLARKMPLTFLAFTAAALSAAGAPPLAGAWSRLWLAAGAAEAGVWPAALPVLLSGFLAFWAFGAPAARAAIDPAPEEVFTRPDGSSLLLTLPTVAAGLACIGFVLLLGPLAGALAAALRGGGG